MVIEATQRLHWTQRVALVRHNLHAARRSRDFSFFKILQAHALVDGTDHVAILHSVLGDETDSTLSTLDNLNAGIAYVHQDAFKAVYDGAKSAMYKADNTPSSRRSLLRVDICQQLDMADHAIDKTANSAVQLIQAQPAECQDAIANAWITGATIIADAVCVCLNEMECIEDNMDDFIRLEYSWSSIQNSVDAAVSALRGIFSLMERVENAPPPKATRNFSISSYTGSDAGGSYRSRTSSTASAFQGLIKRAFSHSQMPPPPPPKNGYHNSNLSVPDANPRGLRASISAACPTRLPHLDHPHTMLTTIPPTPSVHETPLRDTALSPFKENGDYFAFDIDKDSDKGKKAGGSASSRDIMQLDSLDPLYSPPPGEPVAPAHLTLRRLSEAFGTSPAPAVGA